MVRVWLVLGLKVIVMGWVKRCKTLCIIYPNVARAWPVGFVQPLGRVRAQINLAYNAKPRFIIKRGGLNLIATDTISPRV